MSSEVLVAALKKESVGGTRQWIMAATEEERRAALPAVDAYAKQAGSGWWSHGDIKVLSLAYLGCARTAKQALSGLTRRGMQFGWHAVEVPAAMEILRARQVPWLGDLAAGMAARLEVGMWEPGWELIEAMVVEAGAPVPTSAGFVSGWVHQIRKAADPFAALAASPYRNELLPLLFEHDSLGQTIAFTFQGKGFNPALVSLAAQDGQVRALLHDGCLARLLRGGKPGELRPYVALLEAVAPTPEEVSGRVNDYLGLAAAPLSTVAAQAQRALRAAESAGLLELDTLLSVSPLLLERPEKSLVKAQRSWLQAAAKRHPGRASELLALLESPAEPPLPPPTEAVLPLVVPELPGPLRTPAEVAEELAALIAGDRSLSTVERVSAALVNLRHVEERGLAQAITRVVDAHRESIEHGPAPLAAMILVSAGMRGTALEEVLQRYRKLRAQVLKASPHRQVFSPEDLVSQRMSEIAIKLKSHPVPRLLATPTRANGHLDPAELTRRVELFADAGCEPWPLDLDQALLRLPREAEPAVVARAERIASPAGKALARRLREGPSDPLVTRVVQVSQARPAGRWGPESPARRVVARLDPVGEVSYVEDLLFTHRVSDAPSRRYWWESPMTEHQLASAALPSHREVVAAWQLVRLAEQSDMDNGRGAGAVLPQLAEGEGPVGVATALALVYGMTARDTADRVAAVDAVLGFGGAVDGELIGRELGEAVAAGALKLGRAVTTLQQVAQAGGATAAWAVCKGALPSLLEPEKTKPGVPDLLDLAVQCAQTLAVRGPIEAVTARASGTGKSRLVVEARRLADQLVG